MGRLRISNQFDSTTRFGTDDLWAIFASRLHCLLHGLFEVLIILKYDSAGLRTRHDSVNADIICWLSTNRN
jgi:hypothetical protein